MKTYYVSCKKHATNENSSFRKTKQNSLMLYQIAACGKNKSTFMKNKELYDFD